MFTNEQINEGANFVLNSVDPTFSQSSFFNIAEQNGHARVGTTDQVSTGEVITELGFAETLNGLANGFLGHEPITSNPNFIHRKTNTQNKQTSDSSNIDLSGANSNVRINADTVLPSAFSESIGLPEMISQTTGEARNILDELLNMENPEDFRQQLLDASREAAAAARAAVGERQTAREERGRININEFNARGEAIVSALNRLEDRRAQDARAVDDFNQGARARNRAFQRVEARNIQQQQNVDDFNQGAQARNRAFQRVEARNIQQQRNVDEFNQGARARNRAFQSSTQREMGAENISTIAQLIIDQEYYDAMPEFQNSETPLDQQYDPRYGAAYAENLERVVLNSLRVRQEPNYNPSGIGETSAIVCVGAYLTRTIIGRIYKKSETEQNTTEQNTTEQNTTKKNTTKKNTTEKSSNKKNKTKKIRTERTPQEVRNEMMRKIGLNLQPDEFIVLPEINNDEPPAGFFQVVPVPQQNQVIEYYASPAYSNYFLRPGTEMYFSEYGDLHDLPETPGEIIREYLNENVDEDDDIPDLEPVETGANVEEENVPDLEPVADIENTDNNVEEENVPDLAPVADIENTDNNYVNDEDAEIGAEEEEDQFALFKSFIKIVKFTYNDGDLPDELLESLNKYTENINLVEKILMEQGILEVIYETILQPSEDDEEKREKLKQILPGIFEIINEELSNEAQSYSSSSRRKYKSNSKQNDDDDYDDDDSRLENEESFNVSSNKYKKR